MQESNGQICAGFPSTLATETLHVFDHSSMEQHTRMVSVIPDPIDIKAAAISVLSEDCGSGVSDMLRCSVMTMCLVPSLTCSWSSSGVATSAASNCCASTKLWNGNSSSRHAHMMACLLLDLDTTHGWPVWCYSGAICTKETLPIGHGACHECVQCWHMHPRKPATQKKPLDNSNKIR